MVEDLLDLYEKAKKLARECDYRALTSYISLNQEALVDLDKAIADLKLKRDKHHNFVRFALILQDLVLMRSDDGEE